VVIKIEGALLRILDQNGISRMVSPNQVTARREAKNYAVGSDSQGNEFRVGDFMKETSGENRQGEVINIFRSLFVFLHNRDLTENNGVFVARSTSLISVTPKSTNDLGKINPALNQALPYGGASLMPPPATAINKNRIVNTLVVVTKGTNKGLMGVIKDLQGDNARVELATNNKILTINLSSLKRKDPKTGATYTLDTGMGPPSMGMSGGRPPMGGYDMNPYSAPPVNGGATPAWSGAGGSGGRTPAGRFGQTPNPYAGGGGGGGFGGGKTPNPYAAGGRTPAPSFGGGGGGKTPGWAGGGMGGKTPAYGGDGGKTPAWGAPAGGAGAGGRTPAWAGGGGRTPNPYSAPPQNDTSSSSRQPYGAPTPQPQGMPARPINPYGAPTPQPYAGPTPYSAATPWAAPTPAVSAPTPSGIAPTPGAFGGPTPYAAPTPYGAAATPFGAIPTGPSNNSLNGLSSDWAMDFWNIVIEVGPSSKQGTKQPRHHQRGAYDGRRFGLQNHLEDDILEVCALDDPGLVEKIPAEYARPVRPDGQGQLCVAILGDNKGAQRTTQYENDGQWMMELEAEDVTPLVVDTAGLCKIWRAGT
jgi:transcription elongation factor SPT5